MSIGPASELRDAYQRTHYRVRLSRGGFATIHIGQALPAALQSLLPHADAPWAFVTACNPLSDVLPRQVNRTRQRELLAALRREPAAVVIRAGIGASDDASWHEPSLFVAGMPTTRVEALMRPHQQNAIVCGHGAGIARLDWLQ